MEKLSYKNLLNYSSEQLIDLLSSYNIGQPFNNDNIKAKITEYGKFNSGEHSGKMFVKIVVTYDNDKLLDYGVRLWLNS